MKQLKLYGSPYKSKHKTLYPFLEVIALNDLSVYQNYKYFSMNISTSKNNSSFLPPLGYEEPYYEQLTRARRTVLFTDISGLTPMPDGLMEFHKLNDLVRESYFTDHSTNWISENGSVFYLTEPYYNLDPRHSKNIPLVSIIIPNEIAPYCGMWSKNKDAIPGSTSFLISFKENEDELTKLELKMHQAVIGKLYPYKSKLPYWNSIEDIFHE
jgi:hypothetical protein